MLNTELHRYDKVNAVRPGEARTYRSRMRDDPARERREMTAPNGAPLHKLRLHPRLSRWAPAMWERPVRASPEKEYVTELMKRSALGSRVAQSFPPSETLRLFLEEEPQSWKGKTLRYLATDSNPPPVPKR
jgi:hypothetical protein